MPARFPGLPALGTRWDNHHPLSWHELGAGGSRDGTGAAPTGTGGRKSRERLGEPRGLSKDSEIPRLRFVNVPGRRVSASFQTNTHGKCARKIYLAKSGHRVPSLRREREGFAL